MDFKPIPGIPGYSITTSGVVFGPRGPKAYEFNKKGGHAYVAIRHKKYFIHSLLLITFVSPRPKGFITRHLDGNPLNHSLDNLAWGTPRENYDDAIKHGVYKRPPSCEDIFAIKFLRNLGLFQQQITNVIGISQPTVSRWLINHA